MSTNLPVGHAARAHAKLAPSAASRWVHCTASVSFIEANRDKLPPERTEYADEGTRAHELANAMLINAPLPQADNDEMSVNVEGYVAWIRGWHKKTPKQSLWVERKTELFYAPGQHGTSDAVVWGKSFIFVGDLKYGAGVSVEAKDNPQLAAYGESIIREIELAMEVRADMPIILGIYQPRDRNNPEPVRLWELKRSELADFGAHIEHAANIINGAHKDIPPTFVANPEKQCRFCPAKGICKAYANYGLGLVPDVAAVVADRSVTLPSPDSITRDQRQRIIAAAKPIKQWLEAIEGQEAAELLRGAAPLKFKLVEGKSNRQWEDEKAVAKLLKNYLTTDAIYERSLLSPAGAEKALEGVEVSTRFTNQLSKLISKPQGKPSLVPIDDKRPALQINPAEGLTVVPDEEV